MGKNTGIPWCHHTWNPWWGCHRVSPACANCYAARDAKRYGFGCFDGGPYRFFGESHWKEPLKWDRAAEKAGERRRVFCASMGDVFEVDGLSQFVEMDAARQKLWGLIRKTPHLDWLLLTKRPENVAKLLPADVAALVWLGVTAEDQPRADERIPILLSTPAKVRFVSVEPMLGPVDLNATPRLGHPVNGFPPSVGAFARWQDRPRAKLRDGLDWVIAGCESGPGARPTRGDWLRALRDQCSAAGVPFFLKQMKMVGSESVLKMPALDGRVWDQVPEVQS